MRKMVEAVQHISDGGAALEASRTAAEVEEFGGKEVQYISNGGACLEAARTAAEDEAEWVEDFLFRMPVDWMYGKVSK